MVTCDGCGMLQCVAKEKKNTCISYTSAFLKHWHYVHRHFGCNLSLTSMKITPWISFEIIDDVYNIWVAE